MNAPNLHCNRELMVMATNFYYHCWFAGAGLQETHPFQLLLMSLSFFISLLGPIQGTICFKLVPRPLVLGPLSKVALKFTMGLGFCRVLFSFGVISLPLFIDIMNFTQTYGFGPISSFLNG
jgi:hypothetical protein